jgi:DNA-binding transcriptional MerR regulator
MVIPDHSTHEAEEDVNMDEPEKLSSKQAAEYLKITLRTLRAYVAQGKLYPVKDSAGAHWFYRSDLESILHPAQGREGIIIPSSPSTVPDYNAQTHVIIDRSTHEHMLKERGEMVYRLEQMAFRIGQLEAEKRQHEQQILLLEDMREKKSDEPPLADGDDYADLLKRAEERRKGPWWKRWMNG